MSWRRLTAVVGLMVVAAAAAVLLAKGSTNTSSKARHVASPRLNSMHERDQGNGEGDAADAASQAYTDRAYPAASISIDQIQSAITANNALAGHGGAKLTSKWDFIGPDTLDVDRLGTQSFIKPTQWSGRVTALDRRPEVQAAGVHALRRRSGRRRLAHDERARAEPDVEADLGRDPDERDRLDRRRPERPDRQDDLRRHRRGERER